MSRETRIGRNGAQLVSLCEFRLQQLISASKPVGLMSLGIGSTAVLKTLLHGVMAGNSIAWTAHEVVHVALYPLLLSLPAIAAQARRPGLVQPAAVLSHIVRSSALWAVGLGLVPNAEGVSLLVRLHVELVLEVALAFQDQMSLPLMIVLHACRQGGWMSIVVCCLGGNLYSTIIRGLFNWVVMVMLSLCFELRRRTLYNKWRTSVQQQLQQQPSHASSALQAHQHARGAVRRSHQRNHHHRQTEFHSHIPEPHKRAGVTVGPETGRCSMGATAHAFTFPELAEACFPAELHSRPSWPYGNHKTKAPPRPISLPVRYSEVGPTYSPSHSCSETAVSFDTAFELDAQMDSSAFASAAACAEDMAHTQIATWKPAAAAAPQRPQRTTTESAAAATPGVAHAAQQDACEVDASQGGRTPSMGSDVTACLLAHEGLRTAIRQRTLSYLRRRIVSPAYVKLDGLEPEDLPPGMPELLQQQLQQCMPGMTLAGVALRPGCVMMALDLLSQSDGLSCSRETATTRAEAAALTAKGIKEAVASLLRCRRHLAGLVHDGAFMSVQVTQECFVAQWDADLGTYKENGAMHTSLLASAAEYQLLGMSPRVQCLPALATGSGSEPSARVIEVTVALTLPEGCLLRGWQKRGNVTHGPHGSDKVSKASCASLLARLGGSKVGEYLPVTATVLTSSSSTTTSGHAFSVGNTVAKVSMTLPAQVTQGAVCLELWVTRPVDSLPAATASPYISSAAVNSTHSELLIGSLPLVLLPADCDAAAAELLQLVQQQRDPPPFASSDTQAWTPATSSSSVVSFDNTPVCCGTSMSMIPAVAHVDAVELIHAEQQACGTCFLEDLGAWLSYMALPGLQSGLESSSSSSAAAGGELLRLGADLFGFVVQRRMARVAEWMARYWEPCVRAVAAAGAPGLTQASASCHGGFAAHLVNDEVVRIGAEKALSSVAHSATSCSAVGSSSSSVVLDDTVYCTPLHVADPARLNNGVPEAAAPSVPEAALSVSEEIDFPSAWFTGSLGQSSTSTPTPVEEERGRLVSMPPEEATMAVPSVVSVKDDSSAVDGLASWWFYKRRSCDGDALMSGFEPAWRPSKRSSSSVGAMGRQRVREVLLQTWQFLNGAAQCQPEQGGIWLYVLLTLMAMGMTMIVTTVQFKTMSDVWFIITIILNAACLVPVLASMSGMRRVVKWQIWLRLSQLICVLLLMCLFRKTETTHGASTRNSWVDSVNGGFMIKRFVTNYALLSWHPVQRVAHSCFCAHTSYVKGGIGHVLIRAAAVCVTAVSSSTKGSVSSAPRGALGTLLHVQSSWL